MKHLLSILVLLGFISSANSYPYLDGTYWLITDYAGEKWYSEEDKIIGNYQNFYKGYAEGYFYECDYKGQSKTYNSYSLNTFFKNPEFDLFEKHKSKMQLEDSTIYVHRITCHGDSVTERKVLYPLVTQEDKAFYLYEGAIFFMKATDLKDLPESTQELILSRRLEKIK